MMSILQKLYHAFLIQKPQQKSALEALLPSHRIHRETSEAKQ